MGVAVTAKYTARELKISEQKARALLKKYTDLYFGGGYYEGDPRTRAPAKWSARLQLRRAHGQSPD